MKINVAGTVIPYGVDRAPDVGDRAPAPAVDGAPRLNSVPHEIPPALLQDASADGQMRALEAHLVSLCRPWDRLSQSLVTGYFTFIRAQVAHHRDALDERLSRYGGLYEPGHFAFSAPLPLPRAHLPVGEGGHVRVEVAFLLESRWLALVAEPGDLMPAKARERQEALAAAGIRCVSFAAGDMREPVVWFGRLFTPAEVAFWEGQILPCGLIPSEIAP